MIKLVFNRFNDKQTIEVELITTAKNNGLSQVANETKNYRDTIQDTINALEALGKTGFAINTSSIGSTVKQLEYLQKLLKVIKDNPGTNIKGGMKTLDNYGLYDVLPSGAKKILSNLGDIQSASDADSNYASLQGTLSSVGTLLKSLNNEITNIDKNTDETVNNAQQKINELAGTINNKLLNQPNDTMASGLMTGYQMLSDFMNSQATIPTNLPAVDELQKTKQLLSDISQHANETTKRLYNGFDTVEDEIKDTDESFNNFLGNLKKAPTAVEAISKGFQSLDIVRLTYLYRSFRRVTSGIVQIVENAADYEESLNLFTMALGRYTDKATEWSNRISDALKLDPAEIMKYTGAFYNLTKGMGVTSDASYKMATNLTQLTYDMASYLNISNEAAHAKIQSAMAGQSRAVATVGVATQMASLQELAYTLNIKKKVSEMTQAEKTYLRYIQLMRSTEHMQGDLGRTMITPANAIRTLKNQINLLGRAIGQVLTPIIMKAIPYIMALTNVLKRAATALAEFFGYKVAEIDYSTTFEDISDSLDNVGNSAATAGKKVSNSLAPFDDLNQVMNDTSVSGGIGGLSEDSGVWDKLLPEYNMLKDYTGEFVNKAKELEDVVTKIGIAIATALGVVKIADWIIKLARLKESLETLGITSSSVLGRFFIGAAGVGSIMIGETIFDYLVDNAKSAESELVTTGERIGVAVGEIAYTVGGALAGFAIGGPGGAVVGAALGATGGIVQLFQKAADEIRVIELGIPKINDASTAIENYNTKIQNLMGPLDDNITLTEKTYKQYGDFANRLDEIVDKSGKVKDGYEAEAKTIVNKLNAGLGTHIELQDGEIKNYQNVRTEIQKTIKEKEREAVVNAYSKKYEAILGELTDASDEYAKSVNNLNKAQTTMADAMVNGSKSVREEAIDAYKKAKESYDKNAKEYKKMLADKAKYEAIYAAVTSNNMNEVDRILHDSSLTQEYWVRQSLVKMTNETKGPLSEGLIQAWKQLAGDSSTEFNTGIKEIGNEDAKKSIYESMGLIYKGEVKHAEEEGTKVASAFTDSSQKELDSNSLTPTFTTDETVGKKGGLFDVIKNIFYNNPIGALFKTDESTGKPGGLFNKIASVFSHAISVIFNVPNPKSIWDSFKNYFSNNPLVMKFKSVSEATGNVVTKLKNILGFETGGYPKSGDLYFANENGRSEFITHVGNKAAVANQDQMIQAISNAIMAGFSQFNGGNGSTVVYIGNDKVYEGQGNYQSRQTDRYGTTYVKI